MIKFVLPLASVGDNDASVNDKRLDSESSDSEGDEINSEKMTVRTGVVRWGQWILKVIGNQRCQRYRRHFIPRGAHL